MTLNTRNNILLTFFYITVFILILFSIIATVYFFNNKFSDIPDFPRSLSLPSSNVLTKNFNAATILSNFLFLIFIPISSLLIYITFEKTKSSEVIYLIFFLIGCLLQCSRLLIVIFNLWNFTSFVLLVIGKTYITGKILSSICLLFIALFSDIEQSQDSDRNIFIAISFSLLSGILIPLNTFKMSSLFTFYTGYDSFINLLIIFVTLITIIAIIFISYKRNLTFDIKNPISWLTFFFGYFILSYADNYLFCIIGFIMLILGFWGIIKSMHEYYIWK